MKSKNILILSLMLLLLFSCKKDDPKDTVAPQITILGDNPYTVGQGTIYTDPGATASDDQDGDISSLIVVTSNVNTTNTGTYQVKYNVSDKAGNPAPEATRTVKVMVLK
jgi:trimeric autotransporter adhesin